MGLRALTESTLLLQIINGYSFARAYLVPSLAFVWDWQNFSSGREVLIEVNLEDEIEDMSL